MAKARGAVPTTNSVYGQSQLRNPELLAHCLSVGNAGLGCGTGNLCSMLLPLHPPASQEGIVRAESFQKHGVEGTGQGERRT